MIADQAATLREIRKNQQLRQKASAAGEEAARAGRDIRVIAVTSGKGGVGKTNIAANLACLLVKRRKETLVLDADVGLANIDVILGVNASFNLYHVLKGEKTLEEILIDGPGGLRILPSASGIPEMTDLSRGEKLTLVDTLSALGERLDIMMIDTGAGISSNVMYFNMAAKEIIVVATPEPTSLTDAYALIKVLYQRYAKKRFRLIVNMVKSAAEAREIYFRLSNATSHFLNLTVEYLGHVVLDENMTEAVRKQTALVEIFPEAPAARCLAKVADKIATETLDAYENGSIKFFWKNIIDQNRG
jgi:flagellar biosynthesis protein FlhG